MRKHESDSDSSDDGTEDFLNVSAYENKTPCNEILELMKKDPLKTTNIKAIDLIGVKDVVEFYKFISQAVNAEVLCIKLSSEYLCPTISRLVEAVSKMKNLLRFKLNCNRGGRVPFTKTVWPALPNTLTSLILPLKI